MKIQSVLVALSVFAMSTATSFADHSCQSYAETIALNSMNQSLKKEVAPEQLPANEAATLQGTKFLDKDGNETETGIYEVDLGVMEECLDSLTIVTAVMTDTSGKESCHLIKIQSGPFDTSVVGAIAFGSLALTSSFNAQAASQTRSPATSKNSKDSDKIYHVRLETEKGDVDLELDGVHAPISTQNFLRYINRGYMDKGVFHRTVTMENPPNKGMDVVTQIQTSPSQDQNLTPPIRIKHAFVY